MPRSKWRRIGRAVLEGVSFTVTKDGRFRDKRTGRSITKENALRRKGTVSEWVEVISPRKRIRKDRVTWETTEIDFRIKLKGKAAKSKTAQLNVPKALEKEMRKLGIKPNKGTKLDNQVKFFPFMEGNAYDTNRKKKVRGFTGIGHARNLKKASAEQRDKIVAIHEGKSLANDPFKKTDSGGQFMKHGPDTIAMTALYGPKAKVPKINFKSKPKRKPKKVARKPKRNAKRKK